MSVDKIFKISNKQINMYRMNTQNFQKSNFSEVFAIGSKVRHEHSEHGGFVNHKTSTLFSVIAIFLALPIYCVGQYQGGIQAIQSGKYSEALELFQKAGEKYPVLWHLGRSRYFSAEGNPLFHLDSAYLCVLEAEVSFRKADSKEKEKIREELQTDNSTKIKREIEKKWFSQALARKDFLELNRILEVAVKSKSNLIDSIQQLRNQIVFEDSALKNNKAAYHQLLIQYGASLKEVNPELYQTAGFNLFELYIKEKGWDFQKEFSATYPEAGFARDTVMMAVKLASNAAARNRIEGWDWFVRRYTGTAFEKIGLDSLSGYLITRGLPEQCEQYLKTRPEIPQRDRIWVRLYDGYRAKNPGPYGVRSFSVAYPEFPFPDLIRKDELTALDAYSGTLIARGTLDQCERYLQTWPDGPRKDQVWVQLYKVYRIKNPTPADLKSFLTTFPGFPFPERIRKDELTAVDYYYDYIMKSNGAKPIAEFLKEYPNYPKADSVWYRYYNISRVMVKTPEELGNFLQTNPGMPAALLNSALKEKKEWEDKIHLENFQRLVADNRPTPLLNYAIQQPPNKFQKEAKEKLFEMLLVSDSIAAMRAFLEKLPAQPGRQKLLARLYAVSRANESLQTIDAFAAVYPDFDSIRIKVDRSVVFQLEKLSGMYEPARWMDFSGYVKEYAPSDEAFWILQKMMFADYSNKNWEAVKDTLKNYETYFGKKNVAFQTFFEMMTDEDQPKGIRPIKWKDNEDYPGYYPVVSGDGKQLYLTIYNLTEDIYFSELMEDDLWSVPVKLSEINTNRDHEAALHISPDGTEMLLFMSGDIYKSQKTTDGWQKPEPLPDAINSSFWDADARFFPSGIIFVSQKSGSADIYISLYGPDGRTLQPAFPISATINTEGEDRSPFLHPDNKTLYFASDGLDGFGGFDIYVSTRLDDTWRNWSKPRNLGLTINTEESNWHFIVTTDGKRAYSSVGANKAQRTTYIDLPEAYRPETVFTYETVVVDAQGNPVSGEVVVQEIETGKIVQITRPDPLTGKVFIPLPEKKNYRAELRRVGAPPVSIPLDFTGGKEESVVENQIVLATTEEIQQSGATIPINNLFFATGSYILLEESNLELDALANYLKESQVKIEIQGHTDDVGSEVSNQVLSENRARAVMDYLISRGCNPEMIQSIGYGESRPSVPNKDEQSRQKNRRVEFRIL